MQHIKLMGHLRLDWAVSSDHMLWHSGKEREHCTPGLSIQCSLAPRERKHALGGQTTPSYRRLSVTGLACLEPASESIGEAQLACEAGSVTAHDFAGPQLACRSKSRSPKWSEARIPQGLWAPPAWLQDRLFQAPSLRMRPGPQPGRSRLRLGLLTWSLFSADLSFAILGC